MRRLLHLFPQNGVGVAPPRGLALPRRVERLVLGEGVLELRLQLAHLVNVGELVLPRHVERRFGCLERPLQQAVRGAAATALERRRGEHRLAHVGLERRHLLAPRLGEVDRRVELLPHLLARLRLRRLAPRRHRRRELVAFGERRAERRPRVGELGGVRLRRLGQPRL